MRHCISQVLRLCLFLLQFKNKDFQMLQPISYFLINTLQVYKFIISRTSMTNHMSEVVENKCIIKITCATGGSEQRVVVY